MKKKLQGTKEDAFKDQKSVKRDSVDTECMIKWKKKEIKY